MLHLFCDVSQVFQSHLDQHVINQMFDDVLVLPVFATYKNLQLNALKMASKSFIRINEMINRTLSEHGFNVPPKARSYGDRTSI